MGIRRDNKMVIILVLLGIAYYQNFGYKMVFRYLRQKSSTNSKWILEYLVGVKGMQVLILSNSPLIYYFQIWPKCTQSRNRNDHKLRNNTLQPQNHIVMRFHVDRQVFSYSPPPLSFPLPPLSLSQRITMYLSYFWPK